MLYHNKKGGQKSLDWPLGKNIQSRKNTDKKKDRYMFKLESEQ